MNEHHITEIFDTLNRQKIPFIVVGGLAVVHHGYGRYTQDIDLVVKLSRETVIKTFDALKSIGYMPRVPITKEQFADRETRQKFVSEKNMKVLQFWSPDKQDTPIDVFIYEPFNFDDEYKSCPVVEIGEKIPVAIVSLRKLLEMKKESGRTKDLGDIEELSLANNLSLQKKKRKSI